MRIQQQGRSDHHGCRKQAGRDDAAGYKMMTFLRRIFCFSETTVPCDSDKSRNMHYNGIIRCSVRLSIVKRSEVAIAN
jgi:hypothetical protein